MYIITVAGKEKKGAYSLINEDNEEVLFIFEEEDDATRYVMQLEDMGYPKMKVLEIEDEVMIKTCEMHGHRYTVITSNDIVIPPDTDTSHDYI